MAGTGHLETIGRLFAHLPRPVVRVLPLFGREGAMEILEKLRARARAFPQHIVLFEGEEDRTLDAAGLIEK